MHSHVCTHARKPARIRAYAAYNAHMQVLVGNKLDLRERRDERTPLLNEACPTAAARQDTLCCVSLPLGFSVPLAAASTAALCQ